MKKNNIISIVAVFLLASCSISKKVNMPEKPLYETMWSLKQIYTGTGMENVQTNAFIKFDRQKKSAGGNGSCNTYGSNTTIHNNEISFKNIFSTKMYCQDVQKTEDAFFKQLEKADRFDINGSTLSLFQGEKLLLVFESK